jgi:hypothetical protein
MGMRACEKIDADEERRESIFIGSIKWGYTFREKCLIIKRNYKTMRAIIAHIMSE